MRSKGGILLVALFLSVTAGLIAWSFLTGHVCTRPDLAVAMVSEEALTMDGALAIAEELDRLADTLPALPEPMGRSERAVELLVMELAPYYSYEGIGRRVADAQVHWCYYGGSRHFHVLGTCSYLGANITLNARYGNPWSRWWMSTSLLATLVHEMAHASGVAGMSADVEPATQLVTVEVLASMVRDGNPWALLPLLRELQDCVDDFALICALQESRLAEYEAYVERTSGVYGLAAFQRSMDHWQGDMRTLESILVDYGMKPYLLLVESLQDPEYKSPVLDPIPNAQHCVRMNDAAWVLTHLRRLVDSYPALVAGYELNGE